MRWNAAPSGFDGALAAVPVTLLSREEDAHHPAHTHTSRHTKATPPTTFARRTRPVRTTRVPALSTERPATRRPSFGAPSDTLRLSSTVVVTPRVIDHHTQVGPEEPPSTRAFDSYNKFIVCAGHSVSPRSNNLEDEDAELTAIPNLPLSSLASHPVATTETPRSHRGLQRTDSELEFIISELREKITLQQRTASSSSQSTPRSDDDNSNNQHSRKHLKNPVEKMSLTASSSNLQLRRQTSASHVHATRLVNEGTASMVVPAILSSSASRGLLTSGGASGGGSSTVSSTLPHRHHHQQHSQAQDGSVTAQQSDDSDGFRIRAYSSGDTSGYSVVSNPHFASSTSLGQSLPSCGPVALPTAVQVASVGRRTHKLRVRTLADVDLNLDRVAGDNGDYSIDAGGSFSPVGPWMSDYESNAPLASSRSTASLSSPGSLAARALAPAELSPRSRLLWLSDCCSDDAWSVPSMRVLELLRPGNHHIELYYRPASAVEHTRRTSKSTCGMTTSKSRAVSAKTPTASRRASSGAPYEPNGTSKQPPEALGPTRTTHRPRSGSGNNSKSAVARRGGSSFRA